MTTPVPDADAAEQRLPVDGAPVDDATGSPAVSAGTASEADALEQAQPVVPEEHLTRTDLPLEAPDADTAEQAAAVPLDDDEREA